MASGYASVEDVCNAALRVIGYPRPIAEIYEGSRASRAALEIYGQTRDEVMQSQDWSFAYREASLSASSGTAVAGFSNTYLYPSDCLRLRQVRGTIASPNNDPQPIRSIVYNDTSLSPPKKCIATNQTSAVACYIAQITDMTTWDPAYTKAFVAKLAEKLAFSLRDEINLSRTRAGLADQSTAEAADVSDAISPAIPEMQRQSSQPQRE